MLMLIGFGFGGSLFWWFSMHAFLVNFLRCLLTALSFAALFFLLFWFWLFLSIAFCFVLQLVGIYLERRFGLRLHGHDEYMIQHTRHRYWYIPAALPRWLEKSFH
jgi:hypothetical protein